ncbi:MAG TPA: VWA domain-containing protein [Bryobacteraceae bacterium]|nr:VWA domain-containing protein [Bryobacteraceae bacterium]HOQ43847.1 VWA domain-containing protein [Bryobacteraceae bacterium]HPQ14686.1 VWA domain-containing protein [Bryobacteraceae bacterium]HPU71710.1 VWA domain-containing protein [Bryobacteraceae bacterium]
MVAQCLKPGVLSLTCAFLVASSVLSGQAQKEQQNPQTSAPPPRVSITPRPKPPAPDSTDEGIPRSRSLRVDTTIVQIPVTVTDPMNRFVTGLEKEHFRLFEDKVEQKVTYFSSEDAPVSIGIVFDTSGSMGSKLQKSRQAVAQLMKTANPEDEFFLVQFSDRPEVVVSFTRDAEEIQNRLTFAQSKGRTALLDSIYLAIHHMKNAKNPRKALCVISDGGDNSSRYTESEIRNLVREADVQIYAIGIFEPIGARGRTPEELAGPSLLSELAEQTGGRSFAVDNLNELPDVAAKIGIELHNQYVLGYAPTNREKDGKYRRVQVKLVQPRGLPPLRAFWRLGYYAPTQ